MHQDKETSDKIAHEAAWLLRSGNPLKNDAFVDAIIRKVSDAITTGTLRSARDAIREPLNGFCDTAVSLAGSCVSQAEGEP